MIGALTAASRAGVDVVSRCGDELRPNGGVIWSRISYEYHEHGGGFTVSIIAKRGPVKRRSRVSGWLGTMGAAPNI